MRELLSIHSLTHYIISSVYMRYGLVWRQDDRLGSKEVGNSTAHLVPYDGTWLDTEIAIQYFRLLYFEK